MMPHEHKSSEVVKRYLLGTLEEHQADALEEKYFCDGEFFNQVKASEAAMIVEYLQGRLSREDRKLFEDRYLVIPELKKRFEEIKSQTAIPKAPSAALRWQYALAGLVLIVCAVVPWLLWRSGSANSAPPPPPPAVALLEIQLTPGVEKGASSKQIEFKLPASGRIGISMELPGRSAQIDCSVVLQMIGPDSRQQAVWKSGAVRSAAAGASQRVRVELDSSVLSPNDFIAQILSSQGDILETYPFRFSR